MFASFFAARHGRAEEEDGTREMLRAGAIGQLANLTASFTAGAIAITGLATAMAAGFILGGTDPVGSAWAGVACALIGAVFLALGTLSGQLTSSSGAAVTLSAAVIIAFFVIRTVADVRAHIDPHTFVGTPVLLGWLSPFSLALIANPYGRVNPWPLVILGTTTVLTMAAAVAIERRREFGASLRQPQPGPAHAPATLATPLGLALRLQRGSLVAMMLLGAGVGAFAAVLAVLALSGNHQSDAIAELIRTLVGHDGPLYDLLLSYVMVLVGECAAVAGALAVLRARREEVAGNAELVRGTAAGPARWFTAVLATGIVSILLVLLTAWLGAAVVYAVQGLGAEAIWLVLAATAAQLPATALYLGIISLVLACLPRLTSAITWTILAVGVVLAELGGRLGLPQWVIALSPFTHTPLVTTADPDWSGAVWMTTVAAAAAAFAIIVYRRRDLSP